MTVTNHDDIAGGAPANAAIFNAPMGQLDAAIGDLTTLYGLPASVVAALGIADPGTVAKSAFGAIAEINTWRKWGNVKIVSPVGGDYALLSLALADITDAAVDNQYEILVLGATVETATVNAKSYIHVTGVAGASVSVGGVGIGEGFAMTDVTCTTWRELKLIRTGAEETAAEAALQCLAFRGTCDKSVIIKDCEIINACTQGGAANHMVGCFVLDNAAPTLLDCIFTGGTGGDWGMGLFYRGETGGIAKGCVCYGGAGSQLCSGINIKGNSHPLLDSCIAIGGDGGLGCCGIRIYESASPRLVNCSGYGGLNAAGGNNGLNVFEAAAPVIEGGTFVNGAGYSQSLNIAASTCAPWFRGVRFGPRTIHAEAIVTETTTFALDATEAMQILTLGLRVNTIGTGGATLSIGTTLANTDIVNAQLITSVGFKAPALGTGILKILAAAGVLYVTITGTGLPNVTIYWTAYASFNTSAYYGVYIASTGKVKFDNCVIVSDAGKANCVYLAAATGTANVFSFRNCLIEALQKDTGVNKAINQFSVVITGAKIYNCVLVRGMTNITPDAGTASGSNIIPA